jgi:hypothetical protein
MSLSFNQKIELNKLVIGVLLSIIGGLWTYVVYTEDVRKNDLKTLSSLGDSIAGMHVTCKTKFGALASLAEKSENIRERQCYDYFQNAYKMSLAAEITIKKPVFCSSDVWASYWVALQNQLKLCASQQYSFEDLEPAWNVILAAKGLKKPLMKGD